MNYVDWLRNLQIRFVPEKNFDVMDIFDSDLVSDKKVMDVLTDITYCGKLRYWKNIDKNYLASLKQGASVAPKGVYMIQTYFLLSGSNFDTWVLDTVCGLHIYNSLL